MNWKLIFLLSLFGLGMAFATVSLITSKTEPFCWLVIFLLCAWLIARNAGRKFFLHGLLVGLVNCFWIISVHIVRANDYMLNHPREAQQYAKMQSQLGVSPAQAMLITGPVIGIISGIVLGLLAFAVARIMGIINNR